VVIDDGSTDNTESAIRHEFPNVEVLKGDGNLWWTGAISKGMQYANEQGAQSIFWLNDDCIPSPGSLKTMHNMSVKQDDAIIGAACYISETQELEPTGAKGRIRKFAKPGDFVPVDEMSGHCVCIPNSVIKSIGLPEARKFPHYHGDSNYILKATKKGHKAYISGNAQVYHKGLIKSHLEDFIDDNNSRLSSAFKSVFLSKKSLYFIHSQYHYNIDKYGAISGSMVFLIKFSWWISKFLRLYLIKQTNSSRHNSLKQ
jgi:GT2 family glycosyltransferase